MTCQKCLDQRRAILGAVGLSSLQSKVPISFRDKVFRAMVHDLPAKDFPINVGIHGKMSVKYLLDLAFPNQRIGVDVHYHSMAHEQRVTRKRDLQRLGWLILEYPTFRHTEDLESVVSEIRMYL